MVGISWLFRKQIPHNRGKVINLLYHDVSHHSSVLPIVVQLLCGVVLTVITTYEFVENPSKKCTGSYCCLDYKKVVHFFVHKRQETPYFLRDMKQILQGHVDAGLT